MSIPFARYGATLPGGASKIPEPPFCPPQLHPERNLSANAEPPNSSLHFAHTPPPPPPPSGHLLGEVSQHRSTQIKSLRSMESKKLNLSEIKSDNKPIRNPQEMKKLPKRAHICHSMLPAIASISISNLIKGE